MNQFNEITESKFNDVNEIFDNVMKRLMPMIDDPRYHQLVVTKLEEAYFFATKSIAVRAKKGKDNE